MSVVERKQHIEADHPQLSIQRQCDLTGLPRSSYYRESHGGQESRKNLEIIPNYAAAKFAKDARRKARRRTFVLQVPDNKADLVKLAAPCGFKYRTIFNSGGMHLLGEHSKLDNTP